MLNRTVRILRPTLSRSFGASHGPLMPPFARLQPPTTKLYEETELVWDDSVAPETCIDFDAPHVSSGTVLKSFLAAMGLLATVFGLIRLSDPEGSNPVARRSAIISRESFETNIGLRISADQDE